VRALLLISSRSLWLEMAVGNGDFGEKFVETHIVQTLLETFSERLGLA
jgi:hypothetical protein